MNRKFVEAIYKVIIKDGIVEYRDLLKNTELKNVTDEYWKETLELYNNIKEEDKEKMLKFAEMIMIDTISSIFGILDGSSTLSEDTFEFDVKINECSTENELQDTFLEYIEETI